MLGRKWLWVSMLQVYPTTSGGTLRTFGLVSSLRGHGIDVRVHSLTGRKDDYAGRRRSSVQEWPNGTEEYVDRSAPSAIAWLGGFALGGPLWITAQLASEAKSPGGILLSSALREKLAWCDTIVADFPFTYPILRARAARGKRRILSTHNVEHHRFGNGAGGSRALRATVRAVELRAARACDILVCCCAGDAAFFTQHADSPNPGHRTVVVPNGIDVRRFERIGAERAQARRGLGIDEDVKVLLFAASRWGPNQEAFDYLRRFAEEHVSLLVEQRVHILVVGNVTREPLRLPGFTATGRVDRVEPYFAAADAAINPMLSGIGTNVKMGEFMAMRLPILSTPIGARGYNFADGETGFLFDGDGLASALSRVRRLFQDEPGRLREMAEKAFRQNEDVIDMDCCVRPLVEASGCT